MNRATRYLVGILALGFLLAGVIVLLRTLTGERMDSYAVPCALIGGGLLAGGFAWHFGSGADTDGVCSPEGDDSEKNTLLGGEGDGAA